MAKFSFTHGTLLAAASLAAVWSATPATAQSRVGVTTAVNQRTDVDRSQRVRTVVIGDDIQFRDRVITSNDGLAQILFVDGSALTVASNSRVVIDDFVYNPATGGGSLAAEVTQGALRFVGGRLSKQGGQVRFGTPVGTLGVRGGIVNIDLRPPCLTDGRCPSVTASLVFGDELLLNPDGGGQRRRIHDKGYSFAFFGLGPNAQVITVPTSSLDQSALQTSLSGKAGQRGGATEVPTDADVVASLIPNINSDLSPVTVLPRPRPEIVRNVSVPTEDEVGIPTVTSEIVTTVVEQSTADQLQQDIIDSQIPPEEYYLRFARTPGFVPSMPAPPNVNYGALTLVANYPFVDSFTYERNSAGDIVAIRTASGTVLPYPAEGEDIEFVLESNTFNFNERTGEETDNEGTRGETLPVNVRASGRADGFILYYLEPAQSGGAFDEVMFTGYGGVATPLDVFFPSPGEREALVRTYELDNNPQWDSQGLDSTLPLLNPLIAREFADDLAVASTTDLLMVDSPNLQEQPGTLQAGLMISGQGADQVSAISIGVGFVSSTFDETEDAGVFAIGSRRGTYRVDPMLGSVAMTGALANADFIVDGKPNTVYGRNGETFVINPRGFPSGSGQYNDDSVGPRRDPTVGFVDVQPRAGGFLDRDTETLSGTGLLANLASETPVTAFDRVVGQFEGFAAGMMETDRGKAVSLRSTATGDFVLQTLVQRSGVGGVVIVDDVEGSDRTLARYQVPFGIGTRDLTDDASVTGQTEAAIPIVSGSTTTETYVDHDRYGAIEAGYNNAPGSPDTHIVTDSGEVERQVSDRSPATYMVPSTLVPQHQLFTDAGVTECECAFMEWGWWGTQTDVDREDGGQRRDFVHLGTWAAGDVTRQVDIPTTGSATYRGHAVGNVTATTDAGRQNYVAVGDMNLNFDFGERTGSIRFRNFDGRDFGGQLGMEGTQSALNQIGGSLSGNDGALTGGVTGAFVDGPAMRAQGVLGSFNAAEPNWRAAGTFVGQR